MKKKGDTVIFLISHGGIDTHKTFLKLELVHKVNKINISSSHQSLIQWTKKNKIRTHKILNVSSYITYFTDHAHSCEYLKSRQFYPSVPQSPFLVHPIETFQLTKET